MDATYLPVGPFRIMVVPSCGDLVSWADVDSTEPNRIMQAILLIGAGGAMGAVLRYTVSLAVHRVLGVSFPWGTLAVNVAGCLFIGIAWAGIEELDMPAAPRLFLITGILGAFTTFSTFGLETINLLREGEVVLGVANVAGSTAAGLVAVVVGMIAGRALFSL